MIMYSQVANTSFSYALTLNKFREAIPEEHRPSWVKVTTITMVSKFLDTVDIKKLKERMTALKSVKLRMVGTKSNGFEWKLRETKFYNQITLGYVDDYSTKSVKVFPNGSVQVAGCSDLFDCNRIIKQLTYLVKIVLNHEKEIPIQSFRVVMINTNFSINYNINLFNLTDIFGKNKMFTVSFDPDRYSAVKIKFKPAADMKQITASVFSTGKVIVTGAETLKEIAYAYNILNQYILSNAKLIKVGKVDKPDVFDTIHGYTYDNMIQLLEKKGFKPWGFVQDNEQINF
jgi:TATA-box binding protein (TBP) (component of TFIID and TFIIIB)